MEKAPDPAEGGLSSTPKEPSRHVSAAVDENEGDPDETPPRPGLLAKLGLDPPTIIVLFKGSVPPTVAVAMYQSDVVSGYFLTFGYFIAISSFLALPVLPRGKFVPHVLLSALCACAASAVSLLAMWSALQARAHTSSPPGDGGAPAPGYNSSQNVVAAIWLVANTWVVNAARGRWPERLNLPSVLYAIVVDVACTTAPTFTTMAQAETLVRELLISILAGLGLALAANLIIVPVSSRMIVAGQTKKMLGLLRRAVQQQRVYLRSVKSEHVALVPTRRPSLAAEESIGRQEPTKEAKAAQSLKESRDALLELLGAMAKETQFAKWDVAYGKLDASDLQGIFRLLRSIVVPIVGLNSIVDQFHRNSDGSYWIHGEDGDLSGGDFEMKDAERETWTSIVDRLRGALDIVAEVVVDGIDHAGLVLEILPNAKSSSSKDDSATADVEAKGGDVKPGETGFAEKLQSTFSSFDQRWREIPKAWARERGFSSEEVEAIERLSSADELKITVPSLAQLYILLFLGKMMHASGAAVLEFVAFADGKAESGAMKTSRFIAPSREMLAQAFRGSPTKHGAGIPVFSKPADHDHLPPANVWQRLGNVVRKIPALLGSEESTLGFRASCAVMSVGILAYLKQTQHFFVEERIVWGLIMIAISMTMTSGQSVYGFFLRIAGTVVGMILCYIIWYIVDHKIPGIIVFLWLFIFISFYFLFKFPGLVNASALCVITMLLVIGYELQVRKIGEAISSRTGQPVYPLYSLAPYRLATVAGGMLVAFFWTMFPSPLITDRSWIRRETSTSLYLLANYFSVVQETIRSKLSEKVDGEGADVGSLRLQTARTAIFSKLAELFPAIEDHLKFQKWEPSIGGRFPRQAYEEILMRAKRIWEYLILMVFVVDFDPESSSRTRPDQGIEKNWLSALGRLIREEVDPTAHMIIGTLSLLSNSVRTGQSLPPFLPLPKRFELTQQLLRMEPVADSAEQDGGVQILDMRNVGQYGYTEFAVLQVCGTHLRDDLVGMVRLVEGLVGVVDFSLLSGPEGRRPVVDVDSAAAVARSKGKGKLD